MSSGHPRVLRLLAVCGAAFASLAGVVPVSAAAAAPPRASALAVTELTKSTLPETSITGPGFDVSTSFFEGVTTTRAVLAWTGTDAAHHLNVATSADRLHYGNKRTLAETSPFRPDVTQLSPEAGPIAIAWAGSDANHSLNVIFDVYGTPRKLTLRNESTFTNPAITVFNGNLLLAWVGTDANHSLNVIPIRIAPLAAGAKTTLPQFSSNAGPNLTPFRGVELSWTTRALRLNQANSSNGSTFTSALGTGLPQTSAFAPDFFFAQREGGPEFWLGWTGTDAAHHLNLQWTANFPQWPNPASTKTVLGETAFGGPQIAFNEGILVAWTGTDSAHHLNVGVFEGF